jgi:hypothetical protein
MMGSDVKVRSHVAFSIVLLCACGAMVAAAHRTAGYGFTIQEDQARGRCVAMIAY